MQTSIQILCLKSSVAGKTQTLFYFLQHSGDGGVELVKALAHGTSSLTLQHSVVGALTIATTSTTKPLSIIMHNTHTNRIFIFKQHTKVEILRFREEVTLLKNPALHDC